MCLTGCGWFVARPAFSSHVPTALEVVHADCRLMPVAQVNFHTTVSGQAMVTMIYHRKLDEVWTAAAQKLRKVLGACPSSYTTQRAYHWAQPEAED